MQIQQTERKQERMIESMVIIEIDPSLTLFRQTQQKWVSSLELHSEYPKDVKPASKILLICPLLYLVINYCEKNRLAIFQIDFLTQSNPEWVALKMPQSFSEKYGPMNLCYKTEQNQYSEPLCDIDLLERKSKFGEEKEVFTVPAGYKIISNNPISHCYLIYRRVKSILEQNFKSSLHEKYPLMSHTVNLALIPLFCFPEGIHLSKQLKGFVTFNFILTLETGERVYATCLSFKEALPENYKAKLNIRSNENIFYEKAICLLSKYQYTDEFSDCLKHLYRLSMSKNDVPFHKVAQSFVDYMVLPKEMGVLGVSYSYGGSNICFDTSAEHPIVSERAIYCIFKFLPLHAIVSIFEAMMLQKKIIFVSQSKTILGYAVQAFLSFLFPFRWEHVLIPILPLTLKEYLSAPVPLIAGISPILIDSSIESDSLIVNLDDGSLLNDEDLPPLPEKMEKQLRKRLQQFEIYSDEEVKQYLQNPENTYIFRMQEVEHPEFHGYLIQDAFFEFMLNFMKNYQKYWKQPKYKEAKDTSSIGLTEPQLLSEIFKLQDFLSDLGMSKVGSFGYKFTESTIFTAFIERRQQEKDHPFITFFDSAIEKKKTKKDQIILQPIKNKKYSVARHPDPELAKNVFTYDRFPSILPDKIFENEIVLEISSNQDENQEQVYEFLEQEYLANGGFFQPSESSDEIDFKIESLLLNIHKQQFQKIKGQRSTQDLFRSNLSSLKEKNRNIELKYFQKIYSQQQEEIQNIFLEWPKKYQSHIHFVEIHKTDYFNCLFKHKFDQIPEDQIIAVYEDCNISKSKNYTFLIKSNIKIVIVDSSSSSNLSIENIRSSRKKVSIQLCFGSYRIRNFLNEIMSEQAHEIIGLVMEKTQSGTVVKWTVETLIELKAKIINKIEAEVGPIE